MKAMMLSSKKHFTASFPSFKCVPKYKNQTWITQVSDSFTKGSFGGNLQYSILTPWMFLAVQLLLLNLEK